MGFLWSGPQVDTTVQDLVAKEAEEARLREEARKARIQQGTARTEQTFKRFNDKFYGGRRDAVLDFYQPQLDDQIAKARDALTFAFARAGTLNSSMAGQRSADLTKQYDLEKGNLVSQAESDVAALRNSVANAKSGVLNQLNQSSDVDQATQQALAATSQIYNTRPVYSPLGDIFTGVAQGIGNFAGANQGASYNRTYFGPSQSSGSSRTVR